MGNLVAAYRSVAETQRTKSMDPRMEFVISALTLGLNKLGQDESRRQTAFQTMPRDVRFRREGACLVEGRTLFLQTLYNGWIDLERPLPDAFQVELANGGPWVRLLEPTRSWPSGMVARYAIGAVGTVIAIPPRTAPPDRRDWLAVGCADGSIRLMRVSTGGPVTAAGGGRTAWAAHECQVTSMCFSPDGDDIASMSADGELAHWTISGDRIWKEAGSEWTAHESTDEAGVSWSDMCELGAWLVSQQGSANRVCFSPDGTLLASGCWDGTLALWTRRGTLLWNTVAHGESVECVSFSEDGARIASASCDGVVAFYDHDGNLVWARPGDGNVTASRFSPDGSQILKVGWGRVSLESDDSAPIWEKAEDEAVRTISFSPDGTRVAIGGEDGTVALFRSDGGALLWKKAAHEQPVNSVCFAHDGTRIVSASSDGTVTLWCPEPDLVPDKPGHGGTIERACFSSDGLLIGSASSDGTVALWSGESEPVWKYVADDLCGSICFGPDGHLVIATNPVMLSFEADNLGVAVRQRGGFVLLSNTGKPIWSRWQDQGWIRSVCFSLDGSHIASGTQNGTVTLWSATGERIREIAHDESGVHSLCFSPNGDRLVAAAASGAVALWRITGELVWRSIEDGSALNGACFSPDGLHLAGASCDGTVALRSSSNGQPIWRQMGHEGGVGSVCFSPDGMYLATGSDDRTVVIWSMDGKILGRYGTNAGVKALWWSPDGRQLEVADGGLETHAPNRYRLRIEGPWQGWPVRSAAPPTRPHAACALITTVGGTTGA